MQTITPELEAILKDHFQAAGDGFRGRVELSASAEARILDSAHGGSSVAVTSVALPSVDPSGSGVQLIAFAQDSPASAITPPAGWTMRLDVTGGSSARYTMMDRYVALDESPYSDTVSASPATLWGLAQLALRGDGGGVGATASESVIYGTGGSAASDPTVTATLSGPTTPGKVLIAYTSCNTDAPLSGGHSGAFVWPAGWLVIEILPGLPEGGSAIVGGAQIAYKIADGTEDDVAVQVLHNSTVSQVLLVAEYSLLTSFIDFPQPSSISLDKSLRMVADAATIAFPNEGLPLGWGDTSEIATNSRIRIFQWYGDSANEIRTFTGLVDKVRDHRDLLETEITARDLMAIMVDQTFSTTAPQGADEVGAVRTTANGVYLNMEVSDIVIDFLERVGWPTADRAVTPTSYVLDEYIVPDGSSWAEALIGDEKLTGLVGYSAWADELGVFHFAPTLVSQNFTDPQEPVYTFRSGEDIVDLSDETDQYDLVTRIKVRGPLTTTTLQDTWRELWRTTKIRYPVGIWYDPSDSANIRVIDRETKRLYKIRQSDRAILSSVYLGSVIAHPLGLSGDPADSSIYWVLNAPWIHGISGSNSVKKVRKSDNHVLASYSIPSGRWSAIKVSSANLWLTNLDTDRFYKRSKTDASAIANYSHTYGAVTQANPSGIMVDGTTLYLFWANGGTTARFLKCDESAPGTVTGVVKTAGTTLHGGEMDTTTHTECYGDSDSLGLVAKFTLLAAVDQTEEVSLEVIDTDLEDELGTLALLEDRVHDSHSGDAAHPFETRRKTLDLSVITNLAQATQTAQRQLDIASQRKRVLDVGIVGNPALQKTDPVAVVDPVTGLSDGFAIDTYRSSMTADGTYLGTLALTEVAAITDPPPIDDGDATEGGGDSADQFAGAPGYSGFNVSGGHTGSGLGNHAFDGDELTWSTVFDGEIGNWWFAAPVYVERIRIKWYGSAGGAQSSEFYIEGSNTGTSGPFTELLHVGPTTLPGYPYTDMTFALTTPGTFQYWRMRVPGGRGNSDIGSIQGFYTL